MFRVNDIVIYSVHGPCKIDEICEKSYGGKTREYYVMHPLEDDRLTINVPVDSKQAVILNVMDKQEAEFILASFGEPGVAWIEDHRQRSKQYKNIIKMGERQEIAKIVSTLMRKNEEAVVNNKKLYDQDRQLLASTQSTLFKELAVALDSSFANVADKAGQMVRQ